MASIYRRKINKNVRDPFPPCQCICNNVGTNCHCEGYSCCSHNASCGWIQQWWPSGNGFNWVWEDCCDHSDGGEWYWPEGATGRDISPVVDPDKPGVNIENRRGGRVKPGQCQGDRCPCNDCIHACPEGTCCDSNGTFGSWGGCVAVGDGITYGENICESWQNATYACVPGNPPNPGYKGPKQTPQSTYRKGGSVNCPDGFTGIDEFGNNIC